jgi:predicted nucleotidyltransferase component of viral defense system
MKIGMNHAQYIDNILFTEISKKYSIGNISMIERSFHAFCLLEFLVGCDVDFVFKGGTSLLLLLPSPKRLSVDVDIVCNMPKANFEARLRAANTLGPFVRWAEDDRGDNRLPKRRHYKFFYKAQFGGIPESYIVLDVVEEPNVVNDLVGVPIKYPFIESEPGPVVKVPSLNAILGDKLTAFAPETVGVPLNDNYSQQVIKQLFDVAQLFDEATRLSAVHAAYMACCQAEAGYKGLDVSPESALDDTLQTAYDICALDLKSDQHQTTERGKFLRNGIKQIGNLLINTKFRLPEAKIAAAKAAHLAWCLQRGQQDVAFDELRYNPAHIEKLRSAKLPQQWQGLEKLKSSLPECYFHWWKMGI